MRRGDWVEVTTHFPNPESPDLVRTAKLLHLLGTHCTVMLASMGEMVVSVDDVHPTIPTTKELARWRRKLKEIGLALIQEKAG